MSNHSSSVAGVRAGPDGPTETPRSAGPLPTIVMVEGAIYWVMPAHGEQLWTVARWQSGYFYGLDGREVTPGTICGPIPRPAESNADSPSEASACTPATDEPNV
jgi:hypothetical protein